MYLRILILSNNAEVGLSRLTLISVFVVSLYITKNNEKIKEPIDFGAIAA